MLCYCVFQAMELVESKNKIFEYVESRMSFIAPNLSVIVGASSAAKIMGKSLTLIQLIQIWTR